MGTRNSWATVALVETLSAMPENDPLRGQLIKILREQVEGLKKVQAPDGMWRQVLDRPELWEETSCTAMFAYDAPEVLRPQSVIEQLDYEPARFLRRRIIRKKYVHRMEVDQAPVIAPLPERLLDRSLPAAGLLAHILVGKYCDHLPLYRQEQIYAQRHGVQWHRQTLARWVALAADWLKPIYEQIRTGVMAGGYVQLDETPVDYLEPGHGRTK